MTLNAGDFVFDKSCNKHYIVTGTYPREASVIVKEVTNLTTMEVSTFIPVIPTDTLVLLRRSTGFVKGDVVVVCLKIGKRDLRTAPYWDSSMDEYLWCTGIVDSLYFREDLTTVRVRFSSGISWSFHPNSLCLAGEEDRRVEESTKEVAVTLLLGGVVGMDQVAVLGVFPEAVTVKEALGVELQNGVNTVVRSTSSFRKLTELMNISPQDVSRCVAEGLVEGLLDSSEMHVWCNKDRVQKEAWLKMEVVRPSDKVLVATNVLSVLG